MCHAWDRRENYTTSRWKRSKERDHLKDRGVDGVKGSEWILGRLVE
jgi:hypothetical protein